MASRSGPTRIPKRITPNSVVRNIERRLEGRFSSPVEERQALITELRAYADALTGTALLVQSGQHQRGQGATYPPART